MSLPRAVQNASASEIILAASRLRNTFRGFEWLPATHPYAGNVVDALRRDALAQAVGHSALAEYIAASAPLHCLDGWAYLSRAVSALLNGDEFTAIHMAYYAELRASLSFLASVGIGIFSGQHFSIADQAQVYQFGGKTHTVCWTALIEWARHRPNVSALFELVAVNQRTINDWFAAANQSSGGTSAALAEEWLQSWSIDLQQLHPTSNAASHDQRLRNNASYRPHRLPKAPAALNTSHALATIIEFWQGLEPDEYDRFPVLDRFILRNTMELSFTSTTGLSLPNPRFTDFIDRTLRNLGLTQDVRLRAFLLRTAEPDDHAILQQASIANNPLNPRALPIIARAILLLRLSSSSSQRLLDRAGIQGEEIKFWWRQLGEEVGLWSSGDEAPDSMIFLWADVEAEFESAKNWCVANTPVSSVWEARRDISIPVAQLSLFDRVGLWSLGL